MCVYVYDWQDLRSPAASGKVKQKRSNIRTCLWHLSTHSVDGNLFNLRRLHATNKLRRKRVLELLYADDSALMAHTPEDLQTTVVDTTKIEMVCQMITSVPPTLPAVTIGDEQLSVMPSFKYLGNILSQHSGIDNDIQSPI